MKTRITMLVAFILIATTSIFAQAPQQRRTVAERVKMTVDKITDALKLDPSQVEKTNSAYTDFYTAQSKLFQDARTSGERPDRSAIQKLTDDRDAKLKTIFTEDQYTKFKGEVEASLRPQRRQGGQGGGSNQ